MLNYQRVMPNLQTTWSESPEDVIFFAHGEVIKMASDNRSRSVAAAQVSGRCTGTVTFTQDHCLKVPTTFGNWRYPLVI